jgi:hypothetical protein
MTRFGLVLLVLFLLLPAVALASVGYRGNSSNGGLVTLRTNDRGVPQRFVIDWKAPCEQDGYTFTSSTTVVPESAGRTRFADEGDYRKLYDDGTRAEFHGRAAGNRKSRKLWQGTFTVNVRVLRGSKVLGHCRLSTRWGALRQN